MRKLVCIMLPALVVLLVTGLAISRPEKEAPTKPLMRQWAFGFGGYRLGLTLSPLNSAVRKNLKIDHGVIVEEVLEDSPADRAGIREGDIILKLNGKQVEDVGDIREMLSSMDKAAPMDVELMREGEKLTLTVTPEKREFNWAMGGMTGNYLGVELQELDEDLASYFQVDPKAGVLVAGVEDNTPAKEAGLRSGDVITYFNGQKVDSSDDVRRMLSKLDDNETAELTILRHGKSMKIIAKPEPQKFRMHNMPDIPEIPELSALPDAREMDQLREEIDRMKDEIREMKKEDIQLTTDH